jgi:hypothetical protein
MWCCTLLHTDEPHPHVHMIVKAVSEQGVRLNIRKATLREWRREFARHLRVLGVPANATERAVRGQSRSPKIDGIYRAEQRGQSGRVRARVEEVGREILRGRLRDEPGRETLIETRKAIEQGWWEASEILAAQGKRELAKDVKQFVARMRPVRTDREMIAEELLRHHRDPQTRDGPTR